MGSDVQPIANGIRTDHLIPNLPFVDDSYLPIEDPEAIEAIGRHDGTDMWGRWDGDGDPSNEWIAFTTDPKNHDFAWVVRYHPDHGRSVTLYRHHDGAVVQNDWFGERPLLVRAGGYWWDGETWYRPRQVLSWASESYMRRPVRLPTTLTAADLLDSTCDPDQGHLHKVALLDPAATVTSRQWGHDLALWARVRQTRPGALPAEQCVATLNAPELSESTLVGLEDFAQEAGIAASTLRAYIARGEADIPAPQASSGGRRRWARPVLADWLEQRRRDPSNVQTALSGDAEDLLAPGLRTLWKRLAEAVFGELWGPPALQRRWSRTHRTEQNARVLAEQIGWTAALNLESAMPFNAMADMIENAILWELDKFRVEGRDFVGFARTTGQLLGWFVRHKPNRAPQLFGNIVREAETKLDILPSVTRKSLIRALVENGGFEDGDKQLREFFAVALPPEK